MSLLYLDKWHFKVPSSVRFCDDFSTPVHFLLYLSHNNGIPMVEKVFFWSFRKMKKICIFSRVNRFISFVGYAHIDKNTVFVMIFLPRCIFLGICRTTMTYPWLKKSTFEWIKKKKLNFFRLYFQYIFTFKNLGFFICGSHF